MDSRTPIAGPDFICIGMPKAGTGWLFDQLQYHPDFWMPPVKELTYLNREYPRMGSSTRRLERSLDAEREGRRGKRRRKDNPAPRRPQEEADLEFLKEAASLSGEKRDVKRYAHLFHYKGQRLSGDITPGYSSLDDDVVQEVAAEMPNAKIVLLVRDPVARAWSRICMSHRDDKFDEALLNDPAGFRDYLESSNRIQDRSFPTQIVERWKRCAPNLQFRHWLFEVVAKAPERTRAEIITYLGGDPAKPSGDLPANYNRKSGNAKLTLTDSVKAVLVEYFADELRACGEVFGSHARNWAAQYGV
jgi:hypothetical protein